MFACMYPYEKCMNKLKFRRALRMSEKNVVLIGAGIMSATLATLIKKLEPTWNITVLERAAAPGQESSNGWNNAGTGNEVLCELNYTPEREDGLIHIDKAIDIYNQFQISKQFSSHLIKVEDITNPAEFIQSLPHISFVQGKKNKEFLSKRYYKISTLPAFNKMNYTEDFDTIKNWIPLMMEDRGLEEIASTKIDGGTDVNFGELAKKMIHFLEQDETVKVHYHSE